MGTVYKVHDILITCITVLCVTVGKRIWITVQKVLSELA